jgi:hypothetical protein
VDVAVPNAVRAKRVAALTTTSPWKKRSLAGLQLVFPNGLPGILSTRAIDMAHASDLVLQELVCLLLYDGKLSTAYQILHHATDLGRLQSRSRTLLRLLAVGMTNELEKELVEIPAFISERRNLLVHQLMEDLSPGLKSQKPLKQNFDKAVTIKDYPASIPAGRELWKQIQLYHKAVISTLHSDDITMPVIMEATRFNMTKHFKTRIFETRAMKNFRSEFDTLVCVCFAENFPLEDTRELGNIVMKNIILSQKGLLAGNWPSNFSRIQRLIAAKMLREIIIRKVILPLRVLRKWRHSMATKRVKRFQGPSKLRDFIRKRIIPMIVVRRVLERWRSPRNVGKEDDFRGAQRLRSIIVREIILPQRVLSKWMSYNRPAKKINTEEARRIRDLAYSEVILPPGVLSQWKSSTHFGFTKPGAVSKTIDRVETLQCYLEDMISNIYFVPVSHIKKFSLLEDETGSAIESYQRAFQAYTKSEVNWWPMKQVKTTQKLDQMVKWQCVSTERSFLSCSLCLQLYQALQFFTVHKNCERKSHHMEDPPRWYHLYTTHEPKH